ncbi:short-chain dehydrogenase [Luteimicrobium album]|uniref:Short-chain dehydrogenase n=1 Tax=Luteimicrobium album TaxID=1054550 RepID=A0ABQ6HXC3_9MICO|nr:SDR family oxidoreductase [Luteimicrobium album]GMA23106.1 short-chain dehydrogenase [Luteimicrobium album]
MSDRIARTALVVGGTSGIGLATAHLLADRGYDVHVAGRSAERVKAVTDLDPRITAHQADGSDRATVADLAAQLAPLDVLVVTLSGSLGMGTLAELDLDVLRQAFDAKFWAHLATLQAALPHLAPDASVTLLGAISAHAAMPGTAGLSALNAAVEGLVRPLAVELAPIRVNAVSPGVVDTGWWSGLPDDARAAFFDATAAAVPVRHVATADEVAEVVTLVATNRNLSGTVVEADGGARLVAL